MDCHQADAAEQATRGITGERPRILNGIFWVLRSGAPWRDLPEIFGPCVPMTLVSIAICQVYVWLRYF